MTHNVFAGLLLAASILTFPREGQAQRPFTAGLAAGAAIPVADLAESHRVGYHAAAHVGFRVPLVPVSVRVEGFYAMHGAKAKDIVGVHDGGIRILGGTANVVYGFRRVGARPYVIAGAGIYNQSYIRGSVTDLGFNGGVGARFQLAGVEIFAEARLHRISDDDRQFQFVPITFGIEF